MGAAMCIQALHRGRAVRQGITAGGHRLQCHARTGKKITSKSARGLARGASGGLAAAQRVTMAIYIQAAERGRSVRKNLKSSHESATQIQKAERGRSSRKMIHKRMQLEQTSTNIQQTDNVADAWT